MSFARFVLRVVTLAAGIGGATLYAQDSVYCTLLRINTPADAARCYTTQFDTRQVALAYTSDDTLSQLTDFYLEEEPMTAPSCFVPDLKLIFRDYTYVISLYCSGSLMYENDGPYTPSARRMQTDLVFTPSLQAWLTRLKKQHFAGIPSNEALLKRVITSDPLQEEEDEDNEFMRMLLEEGVATDQETPPPSGEERPIELEPDPEVEEEGGGWENE
ncbi:MAG: hypothetical protein SF053_18575 [Bacteroidia bacterium]|nr:hypothetical protein [Bacteroidia bacterium]